jgi:flagellar basal-body rod protein FlgC
VKRPNVNVLVEMGDLREANRAYEADLQIMKQSRDLVAMTVELLKGA